MKDLTLYTVAVVLAMGICRCGAQPSHGAHDRPGVYILRQDGIYNHFDTLTYVLNGEKFNNSGKIVSPLVFLNDHNVMSMYGGGGESLKFLDAYVEGDDLAEFIGNYSISGTTITASIPLGYTVWGGRSKLFITHYEGTLKGRDTIDNWRIVPPYPRINLRFNRDFEYRKKPALYYFVSSPEMAGLDSVYQRQLLRAK